MSGRKRPGGAGAKVAPSDGLNEDAQDIIKENLEVMYDIVMQIREDEEFAKSIYANCPRLQHMLEKRPDLRPIFEDQRLVAINFEQVYREAGGVLPEDEEEEELKKKKKKTNYIAVIVNSPCFKILKVFLFFKKIVACIFGGGMALLISMWKCLCCCFDDPSDLVDEDDLEDEEPENTPSKEALYRAADHMEDPEVQKQMNDLLVNDPDGLADAIEEDPELRELRDTNPLCAELMTDPETMRILTDPENLRALGDAPDLIEADFNDPDWTPPGDDLEAGNSGGHADLNVPETDAVESYNDSFQAAEYASEDGAGIEFENDEPDIEEDGSLDLEGDDQAEEEAGEEEEEEMEEFELGEEENDDKNANANAQKKQDKQGQQQQRQGGFFAQVGAGITDMVAAQLVGVGISELTGQDDPFAGLEEAEGVADSGEGAAATANQAADMAAASETLLGEDMAGNLEDGVDELENTHDETNGGQGKAAAAGAGAAAAGVAVAGVAMTRGIGDDTENGEGDGLVKEEKKKRFGVVGNWASAISTAGKEYIATALLGDDLGEMLVEKTEDKESKDGDDDDDRNAKSDEQTAEVDPMDDENNASKRSLQ